MSKKTNLIGFRVSDSQLQKLNQYSDLTKKPRTKIIHKQIDRFESWFDKHSGIRIALRYYMSEDVVAHHIKMGDDLADVLIDQVLKNA